MAADRGPLTALVLSAAVETRAPIVDCTDDDWQRVIDINLKGPFLCMRHAVPHMVAAGGGSIVAMGSTLGSIVAPQFPAYCASKFGLTNLCKQVAIEHARDGVRVNVLSLGPTDTGPVRAAHRHGARPREGAGRRGRQPPDGATRSRLGGLRRGCVPVVGRSAFTSGAVLPLDGGLAARRM